MMTLLQDAPGWCFRERLLDEAKRMTQDALKDTSRMENENRQDDSVGQEGQGHFRMKYHIGVV
ncbi:hypothetical protein AWD49_12060 [Escherichia coli]|nr:hypothetical protein [Escherichia coli]